MKSSVLIADSITNADMYVLFIGVRHAQRFRTRASKNTTLLVPSRTLIRGAGGAASPPSHNGGSAARRHQHPLLRVS